MIMSTNNIIPRALINQTIKTTLPNLDQDRNAQKRFLSMFIDADYLFLLHNDTLEMLNAYEEKGNPYATYALGRYHLIVQPDADSLEKAEQMYNDAYKQGIADAGMAMSIALRYGRFGYIDRRKSHELFVEALEKDSRLAAYRQLNNIIFGDNGIEKNPGKALTIVNGLIETDGEEEPNWAYLKGVIIADIYGDASSIPYFQKAISIGAMSAISVYPYTLMDEDAPNMGKEAYITALKEGMEKDSHDCFYSYAFEVDDDEEVLNLLHKAYELGSIQATRLLGDIYQAKAEEDEDYYLKAWEYYNTGARHGSEVCMEKLFDMAEKGNVEISEQRKEYIAICGARLESQKLINAVVEAYKHGHLTEFAVEIEQYYLPAYAPDFEEEMEDEELPDDDGRYDAFV